MNNHQASQTHWRKSTYSASGGNANCVEVTVLGRNVAIRDSKLDTVAGFPTLAVSAADWTGFLTEVQTHLD